MKKNLTGGGWHFWSKMISPAPVHFPVGAGGADAVMVAVAPYERTFILLDIPDRVTMLFP